MPGNRVVLNVVLFVQLHFAVGVLTYIETDSASHRQRIADLRRRNSKSSLQVGSFFLSLQVKFLTIQNSGIIN